MDEKKIYNIILRCKNQLENEDILFGHILELISKKTDFNYLIHSCHIRVGVPVNYQTSDSTVGIKSMLNEIGNNSFVAENNYKGVRCQIHCNKETIQIFNSSLEDITQKYPEIVGYTTIFISKSIEKNRKEIKSFILDCTMLPYDKKNDWPLPSQDLTFFPKGQKNDKVKNQICIFCFDLILLNGDVLIYKTLKERRKHLYSTFHETMSFRFPKHIELAKSEKDEVDDFLSEALLNRCSGIICKVLEKNSNYTPGLKNSSWIKINKSYYKADLDSLYFVVLGAKYGTGDRKTLYSSVLLACFNDEEDTYEAISLTHGALKLRFLDELFYYLKDYTIYYTPNNYKLGDYKPDVLFTPKIIVQVKSFFVCLNQSSAVAYDLIQEDFGISLRFPRILRIREDKKLRQICTTEKMIDLYKSQDFTQDIDYEQLNLEEDTKNKVASNMSIIVDS